jgi:hypothetical protein
MAPPAPQPDLNRCWIQKDQPSSPNRLDLVVAVHPREAMQADGHRCRTVSAATADNLLTTAGPTSDRQGSTRCCRARLPAASPTP